MSPTKTHKTEKLTLGSSPSSADVYQPPGLISQKAEEDPPRSPPRKQQAPRRKSIVLNNKGAKIIYDDNIKRVLEKIKHDKKVMRAKKAKQQAKELKTKAIKKPKMSKKASNKQARLNKLKDKMREKRKVPQQENQDPPVEEVPQQENQDPPREEALPPAREEANIIDLGERAFKYFEMNRLEFK